jgi:hypothetical protein
MTTHDPLAELRAAFATGVAASADLLFALEAVPAEMEAALNRFGRPTTSADSHAARHAARLREVQEPWAMALASLPEPDVAADRFEERFRRQLEGLGPAEGGA